VLFDDRQLFLQLVLTLVVLLLQCNSFTDAKCAAGLVVVVVVAPVSVGRLNGAIRFRLRCSVRRRGTVQRGVEQN